MSRNFCTTGHESEELPLSTSATAIDREDATRRWGLWWVLAIACVARGSACFYWSDEITHDRDAYLGIARNITAGNGFCSPDTTTPTAYRPPLFPLLIGVLAMVLPEAFAVALVNLSAGLATVGAVWVLVDLWWQPDSWKQLAAAMAVAVDPLLLRYTAQPMTECLFTALTAWTLVGITRIWQNPCLPVRTAGLTGAIAGLAALCRPTILPYLGIFTLCLLGFGLRTSGAERRARTRQFAGWAGAGALLVSLWAGRNLAVFHTPLLTTTHGGYTLLLGNNPVFYDEVARRPWGTVWEHDSLIQWQTTIDVDMHREIGPSVDEMTTDRWQSQRAWTTIQSDPAGFRWAMWYRFRSFWSLLPRGPEVKNGIAATLVGVWYALLFTLASIGFGTALLQRRPAVLIGGFLIATIVALHLLYWTDTRMRAPLHPVLITFAAGCMGIVPFRKSSGNG